MTEQAEWDKYIRTGLLLGSKPDISDQDIVLVTEASYEHILFGFVKNKTMVAVQTFPLFKVVDDSTLYAIFNYIIEAKLGYATLPPNMYLSSWQWPFTIVPQAYFNESKMADILRFQYVNLSTFEPMNDILNIESNLLYALPQIWKGPVKDRVRHVYTSVIQTLLASDNGKEATVWAYIHRQSLALFYVHDNKLVLGNTFTPRTQQDYVYYIMLLYNQLKINAATVPLKFMGEVQAQSPLCEALSRYVRYVQFADYKTGLTLGADILAQPTHYYYGLFATAECVLSAAH